MRSEIMKKLWRDPTYRKKMINSAKKRKRYPHSKETKEKLKIAAIKQHADGRFKPMEKGKYHHSIGKENFKWLGDGVGYQGIHSWVTHWKGKPNTCEKCGKTNLSERQIHWANIDHKYRRVLDDYIRLCAKCHGEYDRINNLRKKIL